MILFLISILIGCSTHKVKIETDKVLINKFISLPIPPDSVKWIYEPVLRKKEDGIGPTDYELIALLYFNDSTIKKYHLEFDNNPSIQDQISVDELHTYISSATKRQDLIHYSLHCKVIKSELIKCPTMVNGCYTIIGNKIIYHNSTL